MSRVKPRQRPSRAEAPRPRKRRSRLDEASLLPPIPLSHPAALVAVAMAAVCVLALVTFRMTDTDTWQHLLVGKAIWTLHAIPTRQLWLWPIYGAPDVNTAWGFQALIWPVWSWGGALGLAGWRWVTALAAFGLLWVTARRMGARGLAPLFALVLCALVYRGRAHIRPESMVAVLIAAMLWVLESARQRGASAAGVKSRERIASLVLILWIWVNVHISYPLGFLLLGIHAVDAVLEGRLPGRTRSREPHAPTHAVVPAHGNRVRTLGIAAGAALVLAFVNPFGWRGVWQPFEYYFVQQHQLIFQKVYELQPVDWSLNLTNFLPLLMLGWPVLALWRARRSGFDSVEALTCVLATTLPFRSARFIGFYALLAAPYVARDLDLWVRSRRWPEWAAKPWPRAAFAAAACALVGIPDASRSDLKPGVDINMASVPVAAADFIEAHGIRGRGFNQCEYGGYLLYRLWPQRDRLPFMDKTQEGIVEDQDLYARVPVAETAWNQLDAKYHFDYALLVPPEGEVGSRTKVDRTADYLDADSTWALVLTDDASRLYVRKAGPLRAIALEYGCRVLPGSMARTSEIVTAAQSDSSIRSRLLADLERQASRSPYHSSVSSLISFVAKMSGDIPLARRSMLEALRVRPLIPRAHEWLGRLDLEDGHADDALREFELERAQHRPEVAIDYWVGVASQRLGKLDAARMYYRRELMRNPGHQPSTDSLAAMERMGAGPARR